MTTPEREPEKHLEPPRDARSLACLLIDRFGERATSYAMHQALKSLSRGNPRDAARWRWIAEVTQETLNFDLCGVLGQLR